MIAGGGHLGRDHVQLLPALLDGSTVFLQFLLEAHVVRNGARELHDFRAHSQPRDALPLLRHLLQPVDLIFQHHFIHLKLSQFCFPLLPLLGQRKFLVPLLNSGSNRRMKFIQTTFRTPFREISR